MDKNYYDGIIDLMSKAIKIKTVEDSPVKNGPFGKGNKECLEMVLSECEKLGFKTKNLDGYCGYAEIGEGDEIVGIIGHLDVVPEGEGWKYPPYEARIVDNIMYGRGTWDDKGPIIISLYALKRLVDEGFNFNKKVRVIFGCNEESGSRCVEHYIKKEGQISYGISPDSAFPVIFGEKTITGISIEGKAVNNDSIKLVSLDAGFVVNAVPNKCVFKLSYACPKCRARALSGLDKYYKENNIEYEVEDNDKENILTVTVHGKTCHGSIPQYGINAASYAICSLKEIVDNNFVNMYYKYINTEYNGKSLGCYATDKYGDIACNIGIVKYEKDKFIIKINSRLPFTTDANNQYNQIKETLKDEKVKVTLTSSSKGFLIDEDNVMIQELLHAYQEVSNDYESKPICTPGGTYAREFVNCVAFGPEAEKYGPISIHEPNECIRLEVIPEVFEIYYKAIKALVEKVSFK